MSRAKNPVPGGSSRVYFVYTRGKLPEPLSYDWKPRSPQTCSQGAIVALAGQDVAGGAEVLLYLAAECLLNRQGVGVRHDFILVGSIKADLMLRGPAGDQLVLLEALEECLAEVGVPVESGLAENLIKGRGLVLVSAKEPLDQVVEVGSVVFFSDRALST